MIMLCLKGAILIIASGFFADNQAHSQEAIVAFCHGVCRDFQRNQFWPEAFKASARITARAPLTVEIQNGWRLQNMLDDQYFADGGKLTQAGELKIQRIVISNPSIHRSIYVHRADSEELTALRLQAVHTYASVISPDHQAPPIYVSIEKPRYSNAEEVNTIHQLMNEAIQSPTLPNQMDTTSL